MHTKVILLILLILASTGLSAQAAITCTELNNHPYELVGNSTIGLEDGEYVISAKPEHDQAFVLTKWLQIKITKPAQFIVQTSQRQCRVSMVSGAAIIKNLEEKHIIQIQKGSMYESTLKSQISDRQAAGNGFQPLSEPKSVLTIFVTANSTTKLFCVDPELLANGKWAAVVSLASNDHHQKNKGLAAGIVSPPTVLSYAVGEKVAKCLPMPADVVQHYPPQGLVKEDNYELVIDSKQAPQ